MKKVCLKKIMMVVAITLLLGSYIATPLEVYASQPVFSDLCEYCMDNNNVYTVSAKNDKIICYNVKSKKTKIL